MCAQEVSGLCVCPCHRQTTVENIVQDVPECHVSALGKRLELSRSTMNEKSLNKPRAKSEREIGEIVQTNFNRRQYHLITARPDGAAAIGALARIATDRGPAKSESI